MLEILRREQLIRMLTGMTVIRNGLLAAWRKRIDDRVANERANKKVHRSGLLHCPLLTSRHLSPRERESFRTRAERHREQPYGFCSVPREQPSSNLGDRETENLCFPWRKTKNAWDWVNRPGVLVFLLLFPFGKTQAPREQPSSKTRARDAFCQGK